MTVGPAANALTFHKRAGEHFAERAQAADESATGLEIGVAKHGLSDSNNSVRRGRSQALFEICKNDPRASALGKLPLINGFRPLLWPRLRNHCLRGSVRPVGG